MLRRIIPTVSKCGVFNRRGFSLVGTPLQLAAKPFFPIFTRNEEYLAGMQAFKAGQIPRGFQCWHKAFPNKITPDVQEYFTKIFDYCKQWNIELSDTNLEIISLHRREAKKLWTTFENSLDTKDAASTLRRNVDLFFNDINKLHNLDYLYNWLQGAGLNTQERRNKIFKHVQFAGLMEIIVLFSDLKNSSLEEKDKFFQLMFRYPHYLPAIATKLDPQRKPVSTLTLADLENMILALKDEAHEPAARRVQGP